MAEIRPNLGDEEGGRVIPIDASTSIDPKRENLWSRRWFRVASRVGVATMLLVYPAQKVVDYEVARESRVAIDASAKELGKTAAEQGFDTLKQEWTKYLNGPEFQKLKNGQLDQTQAETVQKTVDAFYDFEKEIKYDVNNDGYVGKPPEEPSKPTVHPPSYHPTGHRFRVS